MPDVSDLDFYFNTTQKSEVHYLFDMKREQESQHDGQPGRRL
jgi:hypothetical protein